VHVGVGLAHVGVGVAPVGGGAGLSFLKSLCMYWGGAGSTWGHPSSSLCAFVGLGLALVEGGLAHPSSSLCM
jgi:hypothetical protein